MSLFDKYGFESIARIVDDFYNKIEATPELDSYFIGVDMQRLRDHQTDFISQVLGGPIKYNTDHLKKMHATLNITNADFDQVASVMHQVLEKNGVAPEDVTTIMNYLESVRQDIVTRN